MSRRFRIRVYGKQRNNIDPALLAQVVILFGRHLHQQGQGLASGQAEVNKQSGQSHQHPGQLGITQHEADCEDIAHTSKQTTGGQSDGQEWP